MIKKTITYEDLDGNPVTEDFYFHLSKGEIAKMELSTNGGMTEYLNRIVEANDGASIIATFEEILTKSYGIRGEDNKQFEKSPEISRRFMQTDAYSVLFMELVTDAEGSAAFIRGIVPASLSDKMDTPVLPPALARPYVEQPKPSTPVEDVQLPTATSMLSAPDKELTSAELQKLSHQELVLLMKAKNKDR